MPMSNSSELVVKVGESLLLLLLLMPLLVPQHLAQQLLARSDKCDTINQASHVLCFGGETERYLYKGASQNFTFTLKSRSTFSITVTPCASAITWYLLFRKDKPGYAWSVEQQERLQKLEELTRYTGESRHAYLHKDGLPGVYILTVTSIESDSYVQILMLKNTMTTFYPLVPTDNKVSVVGNKTTLQIDWPDAASINHETVKYCLTVSRIKNFHTYCGALAYLKGDKKPNVAQFGFQFENSIKKLAQPVKRVPSRMLFHQCVSEKTQFTHTGVKRGKTYFVDVFVVNGERTTAYNGTWVKIKRSKRQPRARMQVGERKTIRLRHRHAVELKLNTTVSKLAFEMVPCNGKASVLLSYNGRTIQRKTPLKHWYRRLIPVARPGTYLMTFLGQTNRTFVTVSITSNVTQSKIAQPKEYKIKVYNSLVTCSNVTLSWEITSVNQKYCIYKRKLNRGRDSRRRRCLCAEKRPATDRIDCINARAKTAEPSNTVYNITDLSPNTQYRFDVYVSRGQSASVPYRSVKVKTKAHCKA
ncbi:protein NDNF-like [Physella acuta]|uniref:protein NDNF-like n=1 Tax=Physella acuta TaxID=109671 RepID=UPI0027DB4700|nr:protein NDNF-like [Physella acuta]XP_059166122.1 protein NDNF-like [Physella acuta]XP_059166123.1 protein NDNF-like [Physella acuta]XP_059166124.1 protein NDNF-like [Physella acuta]